MNTAPSDKRKVGEIRPSQLLYNYGVGSVVELPNLSVMVMGLDDWPIEQGASEISEPRLLKAVQQELGPQVARLLTPPVTTDTAGAQPGPFDDTANVGVPVAPFPRWQVCPYCRLLAPIQSGLFELRLDPYRKDRSRYVHRICTRTGKPPTVVPARFLVACEHGHLDDFPWVEFVHRGRTDCRYQLRLDEMGASGEVADIQVKCSKCEAKRRLSEAFSDEGRDELAKCRGRWPHLRKYDEDPCEGRQRAILLGASNSWFPIMLSVLSIPTTTDKLGQLVEWNWADLSECESAREVMLKRKLLKGLVAYTDEQIWEAVLRRKEASGQDEDDSRDLREPEWVVFSNPDPSLNSRDFRLRVVEPPMAYRKVIEKVVLAERVREVRALTGFTRIESPGDYTEIGDFPPEQRVKLSRSAPKWVPTSEIRGEGVFLQFSERAIEAWVGKVKAREDEFFEAHKRWRQNRGLEPNDNFPTMRYVLLHSLAHALIRQFAVECGYTTASIRERIYSRSPEGDQEPMAGILLYTAAPDSEGTLGGLVALGEPRTLGRHLDQALEAMRLCASDPLCAEHHPMKDGLTLHGAACHACLFLPETSCERGNKYLDRSVLVSTVESDDLAFFASFADHIPEATITAETDESITPTRPVDSALSAADELVDLCDERVQEFLRGWIARGLPMPEVGYELQDGKGRVCAQAELAWPQRKVAAMLPEGGDHRAEFEKRGWTVRDATALANHETELKTLLGT
ncbi:MAG: DrmB family protein [Isosphaeraceae bacterium]